ncbi:hypothetical protein N9164_10525 [Draconibacterium sp.]|nr:hypothetical protein [Draconibacterium sp.]
MKIAASITFIILILFTYSCSPPQYFYDESSYKRQKELQNSRSSTITSDIALGMLSVVSAAALDFEIGWIPSEQKFKKLNLINPTPDTMYINMLTDVFWDEFDYCDFMDIRIPPKMECKVLVPMNACYNLYFSNTPQSDDDELLEIFTSDLSKISLYPGITATNDTIK